MSLSSYPRWSASCAVKKSVDCMLGAVLVDPARRHERERGVNLIRQRPVLGALSLSSMKSRFHLVTRCREA